MRKRWVWIGVAATALLLAVFALIPREPDGLDFIRKYQPKSEKMVETKSPIGNVTIWSKVFEFDQVPNELDRELEAYKETRFTTITAQGVLVEADTSFLTSISDDRLTVTVAMPTEPSWLTQQWEALMNRSSPPATK